MTPHEAKLWVALHKLHPAGFHFRRQVPIGSFVVDFACLQHGLVLEVDGGQHSRELDAIRDRRRDEELARQGFRVRRYWNTEVDRDLRAVMDDVVAHLGYPHPEPPGQARGSALPSGEGETGAP